MSRALLLSGGFIELPWAAEYLKGQHFDRIVVADGGIEAARKLELPAGVLIGDFDSASEAAQREYEAWLSQKGISHEKIQLPVKKDVSDTEAALEILLQNPVEEIIILGGTGTRLDHVLANVHCLCRALEKGVAACLVDSHNRIQLADSNNGIQIHKKEQHGRYVSLFPLTTKVTGVYAKGFAYPLEDATLQGGVSLGVSNEITAEVGTITVKEGILLVMESRD